MVFQDVQESESSDYGTFQLGSITNSENNDIDYLWYWENSDTIKFLNFDSPVNVLGCSRMFKDQNLPTMEPSI